MQTRDQAGASTLDKLAGRLMESPNLLRDLDLTQYMDGNVRHNVRPATDYKLAVRDLIVGRAEGDTHATRLPFNHLRGKFEFRRNELTIWTGYKGHGKSLLISQVFNEAIRHGKRIFIFSPPGNWRITRSNCCSTKAASMVAPLALVHVRISWAKA